MVLSDEVDYGDLFSAQDRANTRLGRTVNPTILTQAEFDKLLKGKEAFLTRVLAQPKVWLVGDEGELAV